MLFCFVTYAFADDPSVPETLVVPEAVPDAVVAPVVVPEAVPTVLVVPLVVPTPTVPPPPQLQFLPGTADQPTAWTVLDENGKKMGTERFARTVGDNATLEKLDREQGFARAASISLAAGGGALVTASFFALVTNVGKPDSGDYYVSVLDYENYDEYDAARHRANENYNDAYNRYRDEKLWAAAFLGASGVLVISVAPFASREWRARHADPTLVYTPERAKRLVESHNQPAPTISPVVTPAGVGVTGSF